jgi:diguanylate cyclase (GGDEF)-like protein
MVLDLFSIIPLLFIISLASRHQLQNPRNRYYILASLLTILVLLTEILAVIFAVPGNASLIIPHRIVKVIGFSTGPLIPFFVVYFIGNPSLTGNLKKIIAIPFALNALLTFASMQTGWMFSITRMNIYIRGPLFPFTTATSLFYFLLAMLFTAHARYTYGKSDKFFLLMVVFLPFASIAIQTIRPEINILWASVSMALLLFYIFSLERNFEFDNQTEVRNREGFEREMQRTANKDTTLFVFDLNNLKKTNDLHGHKAGDALLFDAAKTIEKIFNNFGNTFRIGGDEFCVLCNSITKATADQLIDDLMKQIKYINESRIIPIDLAYGFTTYTPKKNNSIFAAFSQADNAMYEQKAKQKQNDIKI